MKYSAFLRFGLMGGLGLLLGGAAMLPAAAAEDDAATAARKALEAVPPPALASNTVAAEAELRLTRQEVEKLRQELELRAAQHSEAITSSINLIESTLTRMQQRQMEAVQSSNRAILIIAGVFAVVGILGLVLISLIMVRAIGRFSEIAVAAAPRALLGNGPAGAALAEGTPARPGAAEEASSRFQSAIDQLQKRIVELEHSAQSGVTARSNAAKSDAAPATTTLNIQPLLPDDAAAAEAATPAQRASVLMGKGQALLNLDAAEPALQCFNEVLAIEPNNAEALVKRGMAFEKLQDWEQALESYNRAIAADGTLTVAYLYRGGVCNRLQRYREALESYEQALHTEKSSRAS